MTNCEKTKDSRNILLSRSCATIRVMKIFCIIIFILSAGIHLYASYKQDKPLRNATKPFILPALIGLYCFSTKTVQATVILALVFSWIGDLLLIPKGVKWFTAGGISFMVSHFFFVLSYLKGIDFTRIHPLVILFFAAAFVIAVTVIFTHLRPHLPKALFYPMYLYLLINGTMNCFAIFRCFTSPGLSGIITMIGAALFFISDASLFFVRFKKDSRMKTHFWVMLTYSLGELLIVLGLI